MNALLSRPLPADRTESGFLFGKGETPSPDGPPKEQDVQFVSTNCVGMSEAHSRHLNNRRCDRSKDAKEDRGNSVTPASG
jgi:hypothetical protein